MKRERVQFLVTVSLGYDTPTQRREAITAARENLLSVSETNVARPVRARLIKRNPLGYVCRVPSQHLPQIS